VRAVQPQTPSIISRWVPTPVSHIVFALSFAATPRRLVASTSPTNCNRFDTGEHRFVFEFSIVQYRLHFCLSRFPRSVLARSVQETVRFANFSNSNVPIALVFSGMRGCGCVWRGGCFWGRQCRRQCQDLDKESQNARQTQLVTIASTFWYNAQ
jgi:hypothetical protein